MKNFIKTSHLVLTITLIFIAIACDSSYRQVKVDAENKKKHELISDNFMITTQGEGTSAAGLEIIKAGGNIIDAAVAVSFAISVERPHSTGIGGGGFLIYYDAKTKKSHVYDFREMAPLKSHKKYFVDAEGKQIKDKSLTGGFAAGTPGLVRGLAKIHKDLGKMDWDKTVQPAIKLARNGFKVYPALHTAMSAERDRLLKFTDSKEIFLNKAGEPWPIGHVLVQEDLAKTLETIAQTYGEDFYTGDIAKKIVASIQEQKADMSMQDLAGYEVKKRDAIKGTYKGYEIISMPPPSSGGTHIVQILNILEDYDLKSMGVQNPKTIHLTSAAMQLAFRDRQRYMGDSDFVDVPLKTLTSKDYAARLRKLIKKNKALSFEELKTPSPLGKEPEHTTHFSLMDKEGNIVVSTQTINGWFGSALVAEGTGIVMNNEMDDFAASASGVNLFGALGGENNLVEARKRPLSSMSPSIVIKDGKPVLALGTPSGTRILTCVAQTILNYIEHELPLWEAVAATRYHHQWYPDEIRVDPPYFYTNTKKELQAMGYKINEKGFGCSIQAIANENGKLHGVSDMRGYGQAVGF